MLHTDRSTDRSTSAPLSRGTSATARLRRFATRPSTTSRSPTRTATTARTPSRSTMHFNDGRARADQRHDEGRHRQQPAVDQRHRRPGTSGRRGRRRRSRPSPRTPGSTTCSRTAGTSATARGHRPGGRARLRGRRLVHGHRDRRRRAATRRRRPATVTVTNGAPRRRGRSPTAGASSGWPSTGTTAATPRSRCSSPHRWTRGHRRGARSRLLDAVRGHGRRGHQRQLAAGGIAAEHGLMRTSRSRSQCVWSPTTRSPCTASTTSRSRPMPSWRCP